VRSWSVSSPNSRACGAIMEPEPFGRRGLGDEFEGTSETYEHIQRGAAAAIWRFMQLRYYDRCAGMRVLDIGNGGWSPSEVLGERVAASLQYFVGLDKSLPMLQRKGGEFARVAGDGLQLPFKDGSFDYVLVNGVLHHLGYKSREENCRRVQELIAEAVRVCSRGLIVYELFVNSFLETLERMAARLVRFVPTFVLSEKTLDAYLDELGVQRGETASRTLAALTGPFHWHVVIMNYGWFKLPACLSPFRHGFFVIRKKQP